MTKSKNKAVKLFFAKLKRGGSVRPNPEGQINKNRKAENKKTEGRKMN